MQTLRNLGNLAENQLLRWIRESIETKSNIFSYGNQGHVYLYEDKNRRLIIKAPMGWKSLGLIHRATLRNEHRVYTRLAGTNGIPTCYGLLDGRYLVLEYIDGTPIRTATIEDRNLFFEKLLSIIKEFHAAGVAHGDLKKKDNILVVQGDTPCVIDFGVAVVRKPGFAPLNHYFYSIAKRFDFNAWVKLKTDLKTRYLIKEENELYTRTRTEKVARWLKRAYPKVMGRKFTTRR